MRRFGVPLAAAVLAVGALAPTLSAPFVYDDFPYVVENADLAGGLDRVPRLFAAAFPSQAPQRGLYRPVTALSLRLDRIGERSPRPVRYHGTNLLLAGVLVFAVHGLLRRLLTPREADAGTLLFAVHPVHVEPFAWVSGRAEILSTLFACASLALLLDASRRRSVLRAVCGGVALLLGILSKENAAVALLLFGVLLLFERRRPGWLPALGAACAAVAIALGLRLAALGAFGPAAGQTVGPARLTDRWPLVVAATGEHLRLLVWPHPLSVERMPQAPILWRDPTVIVGALAVAAALAILAATRRRRELVPLAAWPLVALVPVMHLVPIGETVAERFLLLPSIGAAGLAGAVLAGGRSAGRARLACLVVLAVAGLGASAARGRVWGDEVALWRDALTHAPTSALARAALGDALIRRGDVPAATDEYRRALALDPDLTASRLALAQALERSGRSDLALEESRAAVRRDPEHPVALNHLGARLARAGRTDEAARLFGRAVELSPRYGPALRNLAAARLEQGRAAEAAALLARARAADPGMPGLDDLAKRLGAFRGPPAAR